MLSHPESIKKRKYCQGMKGFGVLKLAIPITPRAINERHLG